MKNTNLIIICSLFHLIVQCGSQSNTPEDGGLEDISNELILEDVIKDSSIFCDGGMIYINGQCKCPPNTHFELGKGCIADSDPCEGVTCSGHGRCEKIGDNIRCICDPGYTPQGLKCVKQPEPASVTKGETIFIMVLPDAPKRWFEYITLRLYEVSKRIWHMTKGHHYIKAILLVDNIGECTYEDIEVKKVRGYNLCWYERRKYCEFKPCFMITNLDKSMISSRTYGRTINPGEIERGGIMLGGRFTAYTFCHEWQHLFYGVGESCASPGCQLLPGGCYNAAINYFLGFAYPNPNYSANSLPPQIEVLEIRDS
jgi:hypothetical protein